MAATAAIPPPARGLNDLSLWSIAINPIAILLIDLCSFLDCCSGQICNSEMSIHNTPDVSKSRKVTKVNSTNEDLSEQMQNKPSSHQNEANDERLGYALSQSVKDSIYACLRIL